MKAEGPAIVAYGRGELSLGSAAEESGLTQWELIDAVRAAGLAYPLEAEEAERRLEHRGLGEVVKLD